MGLTGMIIVDDGTDARLGLPRTFGIDDLPLILQDRSFGSDGSIEYGTDGLDIVYGARGDTVIVNGAIAPVAKVPPGLVRLRLLNAANAQNFELRFSDQRTFHVIASDGGFLPAPVAVTKLTISPAERFEVLVDFANGKAVALETGPDEEMGIFGRLAPDGSADYVPVMRFEPTTTKPLVKEMPTRLVELSAASQASAVRRRQFIVNSGICMNRTQAGEHADMVALTGINGQTFDMERIDVETNLGTSEVWEVISARNGTSVSYPRRIVPHLVHRGSAAAALISRAGRTWCLSRTRRSFSSLSISRQRASTPSCIIATSSSMRRPD